MDSAVAVSEVSEVAHLFTSEDWSRVMDAYVSYVRQVEWITEEVRVREGFYKPVFPSVYFADGEWWMSTGPSCEETTRVNVVPVQ